MTIPFLPTDHKLKTGTNTKKALLAVYNMMSWAGDTPPEGWNRTRHVILLMTDGQKGSLLRFPTLTHVWPFSPHVTLDSWWGPEQPQA